MLDIHRENHALWGNGSTKQQRRRPSTASYNRGAAADCVKELMKIGAKHESQGLDQKMLLSRCAVTKGIGHRAASAAPANTTYDPCANAAGKDKGKGEGKDKASHKPLTLPDDERDKWAGFYMGTEGEPHGAAQHIFIDARVYDIDKDSPAVFDLSAHEGWTSEWHRAKQANNEYEAAAAAQEFAVSRHPSVTLLRQLTKDESPDTIYQLRAA